MFRLRYNLFEYFEVTCSKFSYLKQITCCQNDKNLQHTLNYYSMQTDHFDKTF